MAWITDRRTKRGERRYDVGYRGPDGKVRHETFRRSKDAESFKRTVETDILRGQWVDPRAGTITLADYATKWLAVRIDLSPRTSELYEGQLRLHIQPTLGAIPLNLITPSIIRDWRAGILSKPRMTSNSAAKCYRLLHAILNTAVEDELILRNPCTIKDAGKEDYDERPTASIGQVFALAAAVAPERRALVLLPALTGLRVAELLALRRRHIDLLHKRIIVTEQTVELGHGELITKKPKSKAGVRSFYLDPVLAVEIENHLRDHTAADPEAYLFTGAKGGQLRRAVWHKEWDSARTAQGCSHLHFHDLRHTHSTLTAQVGATMRETMRRLGHSSTRAAMIYQHATDERDQEIALAIGDRIRAELDGPREPAESNVGGRR